MTTQPQQRPRPNLDITPSRELMVLLLHLAKNPHFVELIKYLENRCTNMAIWTHNLPDEPYHTWGSGRVQELNGLLTLYHQRERIFSMMPNPTRPPEGEGME